jgi:hypothetical protein
MRKNGRWEPSTSLLPVMPALLLLMGCNQSQFPLVPVTGTVTFDGGGCPGPGSVTLQPLEISQELPNRPASGNFKIDGAYTVNTFNNQQGVLPGRYRVVVSCLSGGPDFNKADPWGDVNFIAESYHPTELTIDADSGPVNLDIDVPLRKKSTP